MTSRCANEEELLRLLDGELTENAAASSRQHLRACGVCAARYDELERTRRELKAPLPDVDAQAAIDDVMCRLPMAVADPNAVRPPSRATRWGLLAGGLTAALAMSAVFVGTKVPRGDAPEAFQSRGAPMGMSMARAVGVRVQRSPDGAYAVKYTNLLREPVYLLTFAVDAAGTIHWIAPAFLDAKSNPAAVALMPSSMEASLPQAMQLDAPASGRMRVMAILSLSSLRVLDVDPLHGADLTADALRARWPEADVRELAIVHVDSSSP